MSETLPEFHTMEKCDFLKPIICSQMIIFSVYYQPCLDHRYNPGFPICHIRKWWKSLFRDNFPHFCLLRIIYYDTLLEPSHWNTWNEGSRLMFCASSGALALFTFNFTLWNKITVFITVEVQVDIFFYSNLLHPNINTLATWKNSDKEHNCFDTMKC